MSGIQEVTKKYMDLINTILQDKPDYFRGFVNYMTDSSIKTRYAYLTHICAFIKYINKEPEELIFDDFNDYMNHITYKEDGTKTTSSYQINIYSSLKKFSEYLYVSKRIDENYMLYIKRPKAKDSQKTIEKREKGYLTEKELKKYVKNIDFGISNRKRCQSVEWDVRDRAIIFTFLFTGIRNTALRMIDMEDIDLKNKTLYITDKGDKVRKFDLPDDLYIAINDWIQYREEIMKGHTCNALFVTHRRERMSSKAVREIVRKYADVIPGKNITPHKLRATYGTQLYNKTGDVYFVQECMGHSDPRVTELYIRDKKESTKKAGDIMSKLI